MRRSIFVVGRLLSAAVRLVVDMSKKDSTDRVWDIIENVGVCMLTTRFAGGLRARPLEARPESDASVIFFVTDIRTPKEEEIEAAPDVGLVFIDSGSKAYLSISGRASVMRDADKTKAVWRKTDEVWWPGGPNHPRRIFVANRAFHGRIVGWTGERRR